MHDAALARELTPPASHSTFSASTSLDVAPDPVSSGGVVIAPQMQQIVRVLRQLSGTTLPLLILGETGSGKEVVAEWAHEFSALGARPLVKTNCAGLTDSVVESELFGHERGAFTGALQTHRGLFEAADGGTMFLDELGELPLRTQAKLLRVIETGEFCRLGSTQTRRVKVRFIAATHRDLKLRMERGEFRSDLYFRLNGVCLVVPPLRQRREEVLPLASMFLRRAAAALGRPNLQLGATARQLLLAHDWPGNVRELRNAIECAAALCRGDVVESEDLEAATPLRADAGASPHTSPHSSHGVGECRIAAVPHEPSRSSARLRHQVLDFERTRISQAIAQSHGNQTAAARLLGISRRTLTNKLNQHGLSRPRKTFT